MINLNEVCGHSNDYFPDVSKERRQEIATKIYAMSNEQKSTRLDELDKKQKRHQEEDYELEFLCALEYLADIQY